MIVSTGNKLFIWCVSKYNIHDKDSLSKIFGPLTSYQSWPLPRINLWAFDWQKSDQSLSLIEVWQPEWLITTCICAVFKIYKDVCLDVSPVIWTCQTSLFRHFGMLNLMWAVFTPGSLMSIALTKWGKSQSCRQSNINKSKL